MSVIFILIRLQQLLHKQTTPPPKSTKHAEKKITKTTSKKDFQSHQLNWYWQHKHLLLADILLPTVWACSNIFASLLNLPHPLWPDPDTQTKRLSKYCRSMWPYMTISTTYQIPFSEVNSLSYIFHSKSLQMCLPLFKSKTCVRWKQE